MEERAYCSQRLVNWLSSFLKNRNPSLFHQNEKFSISLTLQGRAWRSVTLFILLLLRWVKKYWHFMLVAVKLNIQALSWLGTEKKGKVGGNELATWDPSPQSVFLTRAYLVMFWVELEETPLLKPHNHQPLTLQHLTMFPGSLNLVFYNSYCSILKVKRLWLMNPCNP